VIGALHPILAVLASATSQPADCADPQTQHDMNRCAALDFERADAALNALWPDAIAYVRARDESPPLEGDRGPSGEIRLREAQRAWILFRDAHCAVEAYEMRGGSAEPLLYNGCRARITEARTRQLRALILDR
jgi:uncharacterized protein YecT (DUF1311 family)